VVDISFSFSASLLKQKSQATLKRQLGKFIQDTMHSVSPNRCLCFVLKPSDRCELNVRGRIKKNQQILEEIAIKPNISQLPLFRFN
jgi:hypothetical protein